LRAASSSFFFSSSCSCAVVVAAVRKNRAVVRRLRLRSLRAVMVVRLRIKVVELRLVVDMEERLRQVVVAMADLRKVAAVVSSRRNNRRRSNKNSFSNKLSKCRKFKLQSLRLPRRLQWPRPFCRSRRCKRSRNRLSFKSSVLRVTR
jgi:hypothetical protein